MAILFSNANIVTLERIFRGSVVVEGAKIVKIYEGEDDVMGEFEREYDLEGKYLLPGVIDAHVHFRTPGHEHKETWRTGSASAVAGGVTTVLDMPNNNPPAISVSSLEDKRRLINGNTYVNFGLYIGATPTNIDEVKRAPNVAGVKIYMGASTGSLLVDKHDLLEGIFEALPDRLIAVHAENDAMMKENAAQFEGVKGDTSIHSKIRSCDCAHVSVKEAIHLGKKYGNRLHICHMSCKEELEEVRKFKDAEATEHDLRLTCESCPHHLFLNEGDYERLGNYGRMNPPLRTLEDNKALLEGLKDGSVDMVSTDHAPHTREEKDKDYWEAPSGVPGVQTSLPLILNEVNHGEFNLEDVVRIMCDGPARLFGIKNKGRIEEGYDADLVVVDMELEKEVRDEDQLTKCGWSAFRGKVLTGWPVMTFVNGTLVYERLSNGGGGVLGEPVGKEVEF